MTQQINLYNPALRTKREFITGYTLLLGMVIIMLGLGMTYIYYHWRVAQLVQEAAFVEQDLKKHQDDLARLTEESGKVRRSKQVEDQLVRLEAQLRARQEVVRALDAGVLGSSSGFSEYLRAFARQSVDGLWLTGFSIGAGGEDMTIEGRTLNPDFVAGYIRRLNQEGTMKGRTFDVLQMSLPPEEKVLQKEKPGEGVVAVAAKPQPRHIEFVLRTKEVGTDKTAGQDNGVAAGKAQQK